LASIFLLGDRLRIENKINPGIFDEKRGIAALLIKNSGVYFVRNPKPIMRTAGRQWRTCSKGREGDSLECWRGKISALLQQDRDDLANR